MRKRIPEHNKVGPMARVIAITVGVAFVASGCTMRQKTTDVHHQWGLCTVLGAATGGIIGAGLGFAAAQAISSASTTQPNVCPAGGAIPVGGLTCTLVGINATSGGVNASSKNKKDKDKYLGLLGAVPGGIIGGLAGHYICDPVVEAAPPPPPPAPPLPPAPPPQIVVKAPPER